MIRRPSVAAGSVAIVVGLGVGGCSGERPASESDLLLVNGHVYTLSWREPARDGTPAPDAPHNASGWRPDADAILIRDGRFIYVGTREGAEQKAGKNPQVIDLGGKTVIPGLADAHTHAAELGANLARLDLTGVANEVEAVAKVVERAKTTPKGEWIVGTGWDEGAWANKYPTMALLDAQVPDHPVYLRGLHGFAAWGNRKAFDAAGITRATKAPTGGEIIHDAKGEPAGVVTNSAVGLLSKAIPPATVEQTRAHLRDALAAMVKAGYTSIHEASASATTMAALQQMATAGELPIRVYAWIDGRDTALVREWTTRGPDTSDTDNLVVRSVKVFADGAMGSRGARFLADYSDKPGHRGITGGAYGYDSTLIAGIMQRGFQGVIHAIGDAANRETLEFFAKVRGGAPGHRDRIEHAQAVSVERGADRKTDLMRFADYGVIASMQPSHAVEDMPWAEQRIGPERIQGAYAWRFLRLAGARLVFSSDLPATNHNIFYGLHSAIERTDLQGKPAGGWHPDQAMTPEEAVRGFTTWAAFAVFDERHGGTIEAGKRADLTVITADPFRAGGQQLLDGAIAMTVVRGKVAYTR